MNSFSTPRYVNSIPDGLLPRYEERLRPGGASCGGFMGQGERLRAIVAEDDATLACLGITYTQIADKLRAIIEKAKQVYENAPCPGVIMIEGKFEVRGIGIATNGSQECPFDETNECGRYRQDFTITNKEKIQFSSLLIHLIGVHHFFEGKGTSYRLDPALACRVLELKEGVDYSTELRYRALKRVWGWWCDHTDKMIPQHLEALKQGALSSHVIRAGITAYVMKSAKIEGTPANKRRLTETPAQDQAEYYLHIVCENDEVILFEEKMDHQSVDIAGASLELLFISTGISVCPLQEKRAVLLGPDDRFKD